MVDQEQQKSRADLISKLFAQLIGKFEDAAMIAADCQGVRSDETVTEGAERLREIGQDVATVAEAIVELIGSSRGEAR